LVFNDSGSGNYSVTFYTSSDLGATWGILGTATTGTGTTSVFNNSTKDWVVGNDVQNARFWSGKLYSAQVYIAGTKVKDWNPANYTSGATLLDNSSTPALILDGTSGAYASTPDSASFPTGDAEFEWCGTLDSYSAASATTVLNAKRGAASSDISWSFLLRTDGTISFTHSSNGTSVPNSATVKSNAITLTDGVKAYFKATLDVDNGASGHTIAYYESSDGVTWDSLGSVVVAGVTSIFNSTTPFTIGAQFTGGINSRLTGKTFYSLVRDGIDGTLAFDADFTAQGSNTTSFTESSANAATVTLNGTAHIGPRWTVNGGAHIVQRTGVYFDGTADYMKSAPYDLSQPENVFMVLDPVTWTTIDGFFDGGSDSSMHVLQQTTSPNVDMYSGALLAAQFPFPLKTSSFLGAIFNGASSSLRRDRLTAVSGNAGANAANGFTLGSWALGVPRYSNIFASEVLIYDTTAHDTATQDRLALYAGRKWIFPV
jgi:hypothetical protein